MRLVLAKLRFKQGVPEMFNEIERFASIPLQTAK
jgi:hypothetical protein